MNKKDINFTKLPGTPGVYIFCGARNKILYVGKATSLRSRVRSYFAKNLDEARGPLLVKMLSEAKAVTFEQTDSVLEALILEANLIKKYLPPFNTRDKDNKSFNYVVITKEGFPRVLVVRGRDLFTTWNEKDTKYVFGPFATGGSLKDALSIIRKIFPFRDACTPSPKTVLKRGAPSGDISKRTQSHLPQVTYKPCFNRQIGLCPGVCTGEITKREYARTIRNIRLLFEGKKKALIASLERDMKQYAKEEKFEEASVIRGRIAALAHIRETALLGSDYKVSSGSDSGRIEAYDVAHIGETNRVGVMTVIEENIPKKSAYRKFIIKDAKPGDTAALQEILRRRLEHTDWPLPSILVIDGGTAQKNASQKVLDEYGYKIPIINVAKNDKHQAGRIVGNQALIEKYERSILLANSEAHRFAISFHRQKRRSALR